MEAKLKALKVADLKEILTKSGTPIGSKSNKADLIAKILTTPAALELAGGETAAPAAPAEAKVDDDLLAPPDEFDWDGNAGEKVEPAATTTDAEAVALAEEPAAPVPAVAEPAEASTTTTETAPTTEATALTTDSAQPTPAEDEEVARRRARAERFGVPFVENPEPVKGPKPARQKGKANATTAEGAKKADGGKKADGVKKADGGKKADQKEGAKKAEEVKKDPKPPKISAKEAAPNDDDAKLAARAARFGISGPATTAAEVSADPADDEKKKKREARFGDPVAKKAKTDA